MKRCKMNIGIIDADLNDSSRLKGKRKHRFPNLASMKISSYYKSQGHNVKLLLSYDDINNYDKVFISKVFTDTYVPEEVIKLPHVEYGGTGFFYDKAEPLSYEIEHCMPDYHLYEDWVNEELNKGIDMKQILVHLRRSSRINARTPMQWNDSEYAGFSTSKPWVDNVSNYKVINVENQLNDKDSILNHYKKILHLRKEGQYKETIIYVNYELLDRENPLIYTYKRELNGQKLIVISNFFNQVGGVSFPNIKVKNIIDNNYNDYTDKNLNNLELRPFESYILEIE